MSRALCMFGSMDTKKKVHLTPMSFPGSEGKPLRAIVFSPKGGVGKQTINIGPQATSPK